MLSVSLATIRKWERGTGEPSGAAKTLLAVARLHPEAIRETLAATPDGSPKFLMVNQ
jgi:putative transcriptional regulator